jgi:O-acetyl-ADP-ribose deacetylase (regulator of RNase III)
MTEKKVKGSTIKLVKGDITDMAVNAFVFDIKEDLKLGSGFGGAISVRGGPSIQEELNTLPKLRVGEAVITSAGKMKAKYIIHANGPKFQEDDMPDKLRRAILNSLKNSEKKNDIENIAFPPMGTGIYGVPLDLCADVMLKTVTEYLKGSTKLKEVIFCLLDSRESRPFREKLEKI